MIINALSNNLEFKGLTKSFQKQPYSSQKDLARICDLTDKNIAGNFPKDFLCELIKTKRSHLEMSNDIRNIMKSFSCLSNEILNLEDIVYELARILNYPSLKNRLDEIDDYIMLDGDSYEKAVNKSANAIETAMKQAKILPDDAFVEIAYLGSGSYGRAFNISFKDKNGEKLFHDKTLKAYRRVKEGRKIDEECFSNLHNVKRNDYLETLSFEEFYKETKPAVIKYFKRNSPFGFDEESVDKAIKKDYDDVHNWGGTNYGIYDTFSPNFNVHGCLIEANRALYIVKNTPDIENSSYIQPFFFDVKNNFALVETADDELPKPTKTLDLRKMKLWNSDIYLSNDNIVCGRIVDYGGISKID